MNLIDIFILLCVIFGAYKGFKRGFLVEVAILIGLVFGIFLAAIGTDVLARILSGLVNWNLVLLRIIAFLTIFVIVMVIIIFVAKIIGHALKAVHLNLVNRIAGVVAGAAKMGLILSVLMIFVNSLNPTITILTDQAREGSLFLTFIESLIWFVIPEWDIMPVE
ncbi:MAG TPA: hypothetical protein DCM62_04560 [Bacteroidales bacterium]|nr:hypothetical protein [Bacteroidales bacterium]